MTKSLAFLASLFGLIISMERFGLGSLGGLFTNLSLPQLYLLYLFGLTILSLIVFGLDIKLDAISGLILVCLAFFVFCEIVSTIINGGSSVLRILVTRSILVMSLLIFLVNIRMKYLKVLYFGFIFGAILLGLSIYIVAKGWISLGLGNELAHRIWLPNYFSVRTSGMLLNYGDVAILLSLGTAFSIEVFRNSGIGIYTKCLAFSFFAILPFAVLGSESRNSVLAVLFTTFCFLYFVCFKRYKKLKMILPCIFVVSLFLYFGSHMETLQDLLLEIATMRGAEDPRVGQFLLALVTIPDIGFFGLGPENFVVYTEEESGRVAHYIHNIFLQGVMRSGVGVVGLFFAYSILAARLYYLAVMEGGHYIAFSAAFFGYFLSLQFYPALSYGSPLVWGVFSIFMAMSSKRLQEEYAYLRT